MASQASLDCLGLALRPRESLRRAVVERVHGNHAVHPCVLRRRARSATARGIGRDVCFRRAASTPPFVGARRWRAGSSSVWSRRTAGPPIVLSRAEPCGGAVAEGCGTSNHRGVGMPADLNRGVEGSVCRSTAVIVKTGRRPPGCSVSVRLLARDRQHERPAATSNGVVSKSNRAPADASVHRVLSGPRHPDG